MPAVVRLVRPGNVVVAFAGTVVGGLAGLGAGVALSSLQWSLLLLAAASTSCVTAGGNVLNDLLDRDSDRTNHPDRPLVSGAVSVTAATRLAQGLFVAGVVVAVPVLLRAPLDAVVLVGAIGALLAYEYRFKSEGAVGNVLVGLLTGLVFLYGAIALGHPQAALPLAGLAILATVSRELIKDLEDMAGDVGRRTVPRVAGAGTAVAVARAAAVAAVVLSPIPLVLTVAVGSITGIIYLIAVGAADVLFVVSVATLPERLHRAQQISKTAMTVALVAFLALGFR